MIDWRRFSAHHRGTSAHGKDGTFMERSTEQHMQVLWTGSQNRIL